MSAQGEGNHNIDQSSAFYANNDASSYNSRYLKSIRNKERFQELHFYAASTDVIDALFPKQPNKGSLDPISSYRASAATLNQWRDLDEADQLLAIQKEKEKALAGNGGVDTDTAFKLTSRDIGSSGQTTATAVLAAPPAKIARTGEKVNETGDVDSSSDECVDFRKGRVCKGITLKMLKTSFPNDLTLDPGFTSLVRCAMQHKVNVYARGENWPYASDPGIVGCLFQEVAAELELLWICAQNAEAADGTPITSKSKLDGIHFHHSSCLRYSATSPCDNCNLNFNALVALCRKSAQK